MSAPRSSILAFILLGACTPARGHAPSTCPPCECKCTGSTTPADGAATTTTAGAPATDVSELIYAASKKMNQGDGKGCLADLNRVVELSPTKAEMVLHQRAMCTMLAGRCEDGKALARKALTDTMLRQFGPEQIDRTIDAYVGLYCTGGMGDRDRMLHALAELQRGAYMTKKTPEFCEQQHRIVDGLRGKVKPRDADDTQVANADQLLYATVPQCYAKAGDCARAWATYRVLAVRVTPAVYAKLDPKVKEETLRSGFDALAPSCKTR